jgi:hypothetical protein
MHEKGSQFRHKPWSLSFASLQSMPTVIILCWIESIPTTTSIGLLACFMPCLGFLKKFSKRMNKNLPLQITPKKKTQNQQWPKKKPTNREFLISLLQQLSLYILHTNTFFFLLLSLLLSCHSPKNVAITLQIAHN